MLGGLAQAGAKALGGSRFSLANLVPATLLVAFVVVLAASGLYGGGSPRFSGVASLVTENAGLAVLAAFGVFILAVFLRPFQAALVQVLEGYWGHVPGLSSLADQAVERHRRRLHRAMTIQAAQLAPPPLRGRHLGEVGAQRRAARLRGLARSADPHGGTLPTSDLSKKTDTPVRPTTSNAAGKYNFAMARTTLVVGMVSSYRLLRPRLYPSVSGKLDAAISQNLDLIDTTAAICVAFALAGVASLPARCEVGFVESHPGSGAFLLSLTAYRGAVQSARSHSSLLAAAVDLHRFDMVRALHYPLPKTAAEKRAFNRRLTGFLASRNSAMERMNRQPYEHTAQSAAQPPAGAGSSATGGQSPE